MGHLVDGKWTVEPLLAATKDGKFRRSESQFRNWITPDGAPGPSGKGGFSAESGRYHLYVSHACPWAHRTLIFRKLKGLEDLIGVTAVHPHMLSNGWEFDANDPDPLFGHSFMHQIYTTDKDDYSGRVTVPDETITRRGI